MLISEFIAMQQHCSHEMNAMEWAPVTQSMQASKTKWVQLMPKEIRESQASKDRKQILFYKWSSSLPKYSLYHCLDMTQPFSTKRSAANMTYPATGDTVQIFHCRSVKQITYGTCVNSKNKTCLC